ncbi:POK19 protein, partial [Melanocharis versteri]|nr:POK19 protein [Melanocharis versteri]
INHTTGIPHSPTGQAIVERAHHTLKTTLARQEGSIEQVATPQIRLAKALYTINFLNSSSNEPLPPVFRHFHNDKRGKLEIQPPVLVRDPDSLQIIGPFPLV